MEVPVGFLARLWRFVSFLPFFLALLILGVAKAAVVGPVSAAIIAVGNSSVIIGLWPAHFIWTYFCVGKAKRLGPVLKVLILIFLPIPVILLPVLAILGSLLFGLAFGFGAPLVATFEAVGEEVSDKFYHCFADGCQGTIKGACTVVRDCTDFGFHSYFSYMDDILEKEPEGGRPIDLDLLKLPGCLLLCILSIIVDVPMITGLALLKSPYMLFKGWHRLIEDLIGREGPFLETVCVPFAGLAIIFWPIAVIGAVICAFFSSFFLAIYSSVVAYQEGSVQMGLAYIVSVISMFDEYSNDFLYLREGSYLPRPLYRKGKIDPTAEQDRSLRGGPRRRKLVSEQSKPLRRAFQQFKPVQIWDWLFRSCEQNGRDLLQDGLIQVSDIADCVLKGRSERLCIELPAWCILQCLLRSAKSDSCGLLISDDVELGEFNWPKDKVLEWFMEPLLIMKEQIRGLQLSDAEEACLRKLVMVYNSGKPEDWNGSGFPSDDNVRRAQLQAILRRLRGMVASLSRLPTFRRRFLSLVKELYLEARAGGALGQNSGSPASSSVSSKISTRSESENMV
ncbi:putative membrane protein At3g27390 [Wolffia australiana]